MAKTATDLRFILDRNPEVSLAEPIDTGNRFEQLVSEQARCGLYANERAYQQALINRCEEVSLELPAFSEIYANVNGQYRPGQVVEPGLSPGVPDLFWPIMSRRGNRQYGGMYIELKVKANKLSVDQLNRMAGLSQEGYICIAAWDYVEPVIQLMKRYYHSELDANGIIYLKGVNE